MSMRCRDAAPPAAAWLSTSLLVPLLVSTLTSTPAAAAGDAAPDVPTLRVCADPDNLPYSHADGSGFENRLAALLARELGATLRHEWLPLRRGAVRKTLGEHRCDVLAGVPEALPGVLTTRPYYRSSYMFVARASDPRPLRSFDDPRLASLRIGVQLVGDDLSATPPGHALAHRGARTAVMGFVPYGDEPAARRMVNAVGSGALDAAVVWGPQAGFHAARSRVPLVLHRARPPADLAAWPFDYGISVGVRRADVRLHDRLQQALDARQGEIDALLRSFHLPRTDRAARASP